MTGSIINYILSSVAYNPACYRSIISIKPMIQHSAFVAQQILTDAMMNSVTYSLAMQCELHLLNRTNPGSIQHNNVQHAEWLI